ncbi:MAG: D-glycero-alpha-D-manno-heptose-1,7-bisphosphate 7-phosphatase [Phycisphaerae bacterium]
MHNTGRPAIFLDRDQTLIHDPGYLSDPEQVRLLPGVPQALNRLREAGYPLVVVTNQSGIARGYFTEGALAAVHQRMRELLRAEGTDIDGIYFCPFLDGPEAVHERYRQDSELRKPRPGMLLLAAKEMDLDLSGSWMIGDSPADIEAGRAAGCRTLLIGNGDPHAANPDCVAADLTDAAERILSEISMQEPESIRPDPIRSETPSVENAPLSASNQDYSGDPSWKQVHATLNQILEELRVTKREQRYVDFSVAQLAGAIAQAIALCAIGWGIYAAINGAQSDATIRLLVGMALQLMALTGFTAGKRK